MAIANPIEGVSYCGNDNESGEFPSGAIVEYQSIDRDLQPEEYPWTNHVFAGTQLPIRYSITEEADTLVEVLAIAPGATVTTTDPLVKDKYYTFVVSGLINGAGGINVDPCFVIDTVTETTEPSNALTLSDEGFDNVFYKVASEGTVNYNPFHEYSVGYVGNDANVTFALSGVGTGSFLIAIYENAYRLLITQPAENEEDPPIVLFDETRDKAYLGFNIACGGDCPSRTDFACECEGLRRCYFDDDNGTISKIFEGTKTP